MHDDIDSQGPECAPSSTLWRHVLDPDAVQISAGFSTMYGPWKWVAYLSDAYISSTARMRWPHVPAGDVDGPDAIPVYLWARIVYPDGTGQAAWLPPTAYSILYPLSALGRVQVFDGDAGEWRDVVPPSDPDT